MPRRTSKDGKESIPQGNYYFDYKMDLLQTPQPKQLQCDDLSSGIDSRAVHPLRHQDVMLVILPDNLLQKDECGHQPSKNQSF